MSERRTAARLRLGTRGSDLALRQTHWVAARLRETSKDLEVEVVTIRTTGDRLRGPLHAVGGKGLFIKEIEEALLAGKVDAGVHSMKDLPAQLPPGLAIAAVPVREDPRDALISWGGDGLEALPRGARVGTGSLRRQALLRHRRPDLAVRELRGNVGTRIAKWREGELDALVLARAGIVRLGLDLPQAKPLSPDEFLPAIGQGALAIEVSTKSVWWEELAALGDPASALAVGAERAFLRAVGGDCKTPVAAHARLSGTRLEICALIADPSGGRVVSGRREGGAADAAALAHDLAEELLGRGGREILEEIG